MNSSSISPFIHENINGKLPDFDYQKKCARNIEVDNRQLIDYLILNMRISENSADLGLVLSESTEFNEAQIDCEAKASDVFVEQVKPFSCAHEANFKVNDQIIQINTSLVYCKGQVFNLLTQHSKDAAVHVLRPQYPITFSGNYTKCDQNSVFNIGREKSKFETDNNNTQHYKSPSSTYQTLNSNISLQQYLLQSLLEKKRLKHKVTAEKSINYQDTFEKSSEWIVKKRSNGERYITKRTRRPDEKSPRRRLLLPGRYANSEGMPEKSIDNKSMKSEPCDSLISRKNNLMFENLVTDNLSFDLTT